jgi:hypothetical protein
MSKIFVSFFLLFFIFNGRLSSIDKLTEKQMETIAKEVSKVNLLRRMLSYEQSQFSFDYLYNLKEKKILHDRYNRILKLTKDNIVMSASVMKKKNWNKKFLVFYCEYKGRLTKKPNMLISEGEYIPISSSIVAVTVNGEFYYLRGFETNDFMDLVNNCIRPELDKSEFLDIVDLFFSTLYPDEELIDSVSITKYKNLKNINLPIFRQDSTGLQYEAFTYLPYHPSDSGEVKKIVFYLSKEKKFSVIKNKID